MNDKPLAEFIVFFDSLTAIKTMLYSEFEAVLDGMLGLSEFNGQLQHAAYISLEDEGAIENVVLFKAEFDEAGKPSIPHLPLRRLASQAYPWATINDQVVSLTSAQQCQDLRVIEFLWDIEEEDIPGFVSELKRLQDSPSFKRGVELDPYVQSFMPASKTHLKNGRSAKFNFIYDFNDIVGNTEPAEKKTDEKTKSRLHDLQTRMLEVQSALKAQRLEFKNNLLKSKLAHQKEIQELTQQQEESILQLKGELQEAQNQKLKMADELIAAQQYIQQLQMDVSEVKELNRELADEVDQFENLNDEYKDVCNKLEFSRQRAAQSDDLQNRIEKLEDEKDALQQTLKDSELLTPETLSDKMEEMSVVFVHIHPVVGHMTISAGDLVSFLKDADGFVAARFGVTKYLYQQWLQHNKQLTCTHEGCQRKIPGVLKPSKFIPGDSDRCHVHREVSKSLSA